MNKFFTSTLAVAAIFAIGATAPVVAQNQTPGIGVVDMERVFDAAEAKRTGEEQLRAQGQQIEQRLVSLRDAALLPTAMWQEYRTLLEKPNPTDADRQRITAIRGQVTKLDGELKQLQQTPSPNEQQKSRLNELSGTQTTNVGNLQNVAGTYHQQVFDL
jgi:Skp family chaperone for outer membrane proteins